MKFLFLLAFMTSAYEALAEDLLTTKQLFSYANFTTESGKNIPQIQVGFETYGKLNATKSNVILVTHHFSGSSHAAGKYSASDVASGYWDAIIGSGKAIDTDKYFVISSDTLVNINPKSPSVITTGPLSINPATNAPYGLDFPVISYSDFVKVQKLLLDSLGINHLVAVAGPSAGAMQALQWSVDYPDMMDKVLAVISPGLATPSYTIGVFNGWISPIESDLNWNKGKYSENSLPILGMTNAFKAVTLSTVDFAWAEKNFGTQAANPAQSPLDNVLYPYLIESKLDQSAASKVKFSDANSFIYMVRASQAFNIENKIQRLKAKVLFVSSASDQLFPPFLAERAAETINKQGGEARVIQLTGIGGHLLGIIGIGQASADIGNFLGSTK